MIIDDNNDNDDADQLQRARSWNAGPVPPPFALN